MREREVYIIYVYIPHCSMPRASDCPHFLTPDPDVVMTNCMLVTSALMPQFATD